MCHKYSPPNNLFIQLIKNLSDEYTILSYTKRSCSCYFFKPHTPFLHLGPTLMSCHSWSLQNLNLKKKKKKKKSKIVAFISKLKWKNSVD